MKPSFEKSVDTQTLIRHLRTTQPGDFVSYETLEALIPGTKLRGKGLSPCVIKELVKEKIVLACVSGKGYKRLTDEEIVDLPVVTTARIRRMTRATGKKVMTADYDKLSADRKTQLNAHLSFLTALDLMTTTKAQSKLALEVGKVGQRLELSDTLELLKK